MKFAAIILTLVSWLSNPDNQIGQDDQSQARASGAMFDYGPFWPHHLHCYYWNQDSDNGKSDSGQDSEGWTTSDRLTGALILVAIIQATIYWFQWRKMRETLEHARISSERGLRAYVSTVDPTHEGFVTNEFTDLANSRFSVFIKNLGQTPAYDITSVFEWDYLEGSAADWPIGKPFNLPPNNADTPGSITLGAGQKGQIVGILSSAKNGVTLAQILERYRLQEVTVFIFGRVSYDDIYRQRRRNTRFCRVMIKDGKAFTHRLHNDSD